MKIAQEEIFGPVLAMLGFDDMDQVIEQGQSKSYTDWPRRFGPMNQEGAQFRGNFKRARCGSTPTD